MLTQTDKFQVEIASNPENIVKVEPLIEKIVRDHKLSDELFSNMLVALTEAVNNGIIHGNKCIESKKVSVTVEINPSLINFIVGDEGPGFDYNNLPDPTSPENLEKPTGRGIFLMMHLADMVIFSADGNAVEIQFKI